MAAVKQSSVVLKTVKKIVVQFCLFESNARPTREFLSAVGSTRARSTNSSCEVTALVEHDASEPLVDVTYADGQRLLMKGEKLTCSEMFQAFHSHCQAKDPEAKVKG